MPTCWIGLDGLGLDMPLIVTRQVSTWDQPEGWDDARGEQRKLQWEQQKAKKKQRRRDEKKKAEEDAKAAAAT